VLLGGNAPFAAKATIAASAGLLDISSNAVISLLYVAVVSMSSGSSPRIILFNVSAGKLNLPAVLVPALSAARSAAISSAKALSRVLALAPLAALIFPISSPRSEPVLAYAEPAALDLFFLLKVEPI